MFWRSCGFPGGLIGLSVLAASPQATAQMAAGVVDVELQVERGCVLMRAPDPGMVEFGRIDFGRHARLDAAAGPPTGHNLASDDPQAPGARLECNPDTAFRFEVDAGLHGGADGVRHLRLQRPGRSDAVTLAYRLFLDPARRMPLQANTPIAGITPVDGRVHLPLYAQIEPSASAPAVGTYRDTLHITIDW